MNRLNNTEFFGNADQQAVTRRSANLWSLVRDDPRFCCHGRAVAVSWAPPDRLDLQISLARLQGVAACEDVPNGELANYRSALEQVGLKTDVFENWYSADNALTNARRILSERALPDDLELVFVDADTPCDDLYALAGLTESCGVLLPMGRFMRGLERPAVCVFARNSSGKPVCSSAAVDMFHPSSEHAGLSWWGMLATDEDWRGQGLALLMGAHSMLAMHNRFGTTSFFTGIRSDNAPSKALCTKLGLVQGNNSVVIGIDPQTFGGSRITK